MAGCGLPFTYLAVQPGRVDHAVPDQAALDGLGVGEGVSVLSWDAATSTAYARVFAGDLQLGRGPGDRLRGARSRASGWSPPACCGGEGTSSYVVRQGEKMGRPSVLTCTVTASGGTAVSATVQGAVVPIASGRIRVPALSTHRRPTPGRCTARARGTSACSPWPSSASRSRRR